MAFDDRVQTFQVLCSCWSLMANSTCAAGSTAVTGWRTERRAAVPSGLSLGIDRGCTTREDEAQGLHTKPQSISTKLGEASDCHVQSCVMSQLKQSAWPCVSKPEPHCLPCCPCRRAISSAACLAAATGTLSRSIRLSVESVAQNGWTRAMHAWALSPPCNSIV